MLTPAAGLSSFGSVLGRRDCLRRHALLNPLLKRALDVQHVRSGPALAVVEPGRQE